MKRVMLPAVLAVLMAAGAVSLKAAEENKSQRRGGRTIPMTMEQIKERLGEDQALKEDQVAKVQAINEEFAKKMEEVKEKPEVKAAQEEMTKAREARDFNKMREAFTKLNEAMGFNAVEDYKKALSGVLNEQQVAKLFPPRRPRGGAEGGTEGGTPGAAAPEGGEKQAEP